MNSKTKGNAIERTEFKVGRNPFTFSGHFKPEWDEYVSIEGYANPFTGKLLERKECTVISCQHSCGFEEHDSRAEWFEVRLHDDGTVEPVGQRWKA